MSARGRADLSGEEQPRWWPSSRSGCRHPTAPSFRGINGAQRSQRTDSFANTAVLRAGPSPCASRACTIKPSILTSRQSSSLTTPRLCLRARMHGLYDAAVVSPARSINRAASACDDAGLAPAGLMLAAAAGVQTGERSSSTDCWASRSAIAAGMHGEPHLSTHKLSDLDRLMERAAALPWHRSISWSHLRPPLDLWHDTRFLAAAGRGEAWVKFMQPRSARAVMHAIPAGPPSTSIKSID